MKIKLPRWVKGQVPRADDLNRLPELLERLANLVVDGSTGLQLEETAAGWKLSYIPRQVFFYATITTACPACVVVGTTKTYGKGAGTLDIETYASTGVCTGTPTNPARTVVIYNGGLEAVAVGHRVLVYEKEPGRWHIPTHFCQ